MHQTPGFGRRIFCGGAAASAARQEPAKSDTLNPSMTPRLSHHLYFAALFDTGRALSFPCDRGGEVQLDGLSERARNNYFFARTVVGRDYGLPIVIALENGSTH